MTLPSTFLSQVLLFLSFSLFLLAPSLPFYPNSAARRRRPDPLFGIAEARFLPPGPVPASCIGTAGEASARERTIQQAEGEGGTREQHT